MTENPITPKIQELRRTQRILKRQIQSRTADFEKAKESLQTEINKVKQIETELKTELHERTSDLARVTESLVAEMSAHAQAEQALRISKARHAEASNFNHAVMASMREGLYTLDTRGLATYINPAAERLFGWSSEELLGRKMHDIIHYQHPDGKAFPADECALLQVLRTGAALLVYEDVFIRKDRTFFPVVYSSSPIKSGGEIVGLVVVFRDVTTRKETEEALRRSREE
ncbi:MAG TPA: PAS domain S-box protein [Candidatus Binatia bacterium]|jgi:PAS domain S-box-containing protein